MQQQMVKMRSGESIRRGIKLYSKLFLIIGEPLGGKAQSRDDQHIQLGAASVAAEYRIIVPKKRVRRAVDRNFIKRRLRAVLFSYAKQYGLSGRFVIIGAPTAASADFATFKKEFWRLMRLFERQSFAGASSALPSASSAAPGAPATSAASTSRKVSSRKVSYKTDTSGGASDE
jgi:ribonuclease P protein component